MEGWKVIKGREKKNLKPTQEHYDRAIERLNRKIIEGKADSCDHEKLLFLYVKSLSKHRDFNGMDYDDLSDLLSNYSIVTDSMGYLTPIQFMRLFPVEKSYDGAKWQMKDYFSCMEKARKYDSNKPIGTDRIQEFLMEYWNPDIINFEVCKMLCASALRKAMGGKGIMEEFMEEHGVPSYTLYDDGIMVNNMTGETMKVQKAKKRKPKWLKVVG